MNEIQTPVKLGPETVSGQAEKVQPDVREAMENLSKGQGKEQSNAEDKAQLIAEVKDNLAKVNEFLPVTSTNLSFEFDENGDPPFIRVLDRDSKEVIREIPSEEFREVAKALDEFADKLTGRGLLFDRTA